jgi:hypothetical protein
MWSQAIKISTSPKWNLWAGHIIELLSYIQGWKRSVKFPGIPILFFHIFRSFSYYSVNTVIGTKTGYGVVRIGRNTVGLPYRLFLDWAGKSGNFPDLSRISRTVHLSFPALFIWAGPAIFFLLIQRFFKYSNNSNL